jgi:hypothetical protein
LSGWPKTFGQRVTRDAKKANKKSTAAISFIINPGEKEIVDALDVPTGLLEPTVCSNTKWAPVTAKITYGRK